MKAKTNVGRTRTTTPKRTTKPSSRPKRKKASGRSPAAKVTERKKSGLGKFFSPHNLQESLKSVGNLRSMVKNWMTYLQQADTLLDTVYATSNSLKESGVLDKIVKQRGKNLSTEDFTNILIALMKSPVGGQVLKSMGNSGESTEKPEE